MERRRHHRLPFAVAVEVRPLSGEATEEIAATTQDICMTGLLIRDVKPLPLGTPCAIAIALSSGDMEIPIRARDEGSCPGSLWPSTGASREKNNAPSKNRR